MDAHADPDAIIVRRLLPGDAPAACALFAAGMMETIEGGLRSAALRPSLGAGLGALALAAAHAFATRRGGVAPSTAHAAAAAAVGAAVTYCFPNTPKACAHTRGSAQRRAGRIEEARTDVVLLLCYYRCQAKGRAACAGRDGKRWVPC